jgi:hypothetical protein
MERLTARRLTLVVAFLVPLAAFGLRIPAGFVRSGATPRPTRFMQACGYGSVCSHTAVKVIPPSFCVGLECLLRRIPAGDQAALCMRARGWSYREGFDTFRPTGD